MMVRQTNPQHKRGLHKTRNDTHTQKVCSPLQPRLRYLRYIQCPLYHEGSKATLSPPTIIIHTYAYVNCMRCSTHQTRPSTLKNGNEKELNLWDPFVRVPSAYHTYCCCTSTLLHNDHFFRGACTPGPSGAWPIRGRPPLPW